jgi:succinyl-CoA synthetase beta subunit
MKIHEYQGKEILRQFGVPVPRGIPAFTVQEAVEAAQKLGGPVWVVKAQIHAGGRGKGGGVKVAKTIEDVKRISGSSRPTRPALKARRFAACTSKTALTSKRNTTFPW